MREIKFRAWDGKKMLTPIDLSQNKKYWLGNLDGKLMQYIGLKDQNEKEIYEGDILNFTYWYFDGNEAETFLIGEVCYLNEKASYGLTHITNEEWIRHIGGKKGDENTQSFSGWQFTSDDIEIIGNIHESPELLTNMK